MDLTAGDEAEPDKHGYDNVKHSAPSALPWRLTARLKPTMKKKTSLEGSKKIINFKEFPNKSPSLPARGATAALQDEVWLSQFLVSSRMSCGQMIHL